jgi:hypothetical protein
MTDNKRCYFLLVLALSRDILAIYEFAQQDGMGWDD